MRRIWEDPEPLGGPVASVFRVDDASMVGEVRRAAEAMAQDASLGEVPRGELALVVTELATNLARHARHGRILLSAVEQDGTKGIEVVTIDEGPGIANLARALEDGFSTAGTAGKGLGAIRRLAGEFDLYSRPGEGGGAGTVSMARVWASGSRAPDPSPHEVGALCVPLTGETACGDAWLVLPEEERTTVVVVDGLGHGPDAAVAATAAIRVVGEHPTATPSAMIQRAHGALRATRGAAMAIAVVDRRRRQATFAGVGNVSASLIAPDGRSKSLVSFNGTVGHAMRSVQEYVHAWPSGGTLVMHTDGINTRWRMDAYPGLLVHAPSLLAGTLFRDASRGRDDATVVALRERSDR